MDITSPTVEIPMSVPSPAINSLSTISIFKEPTGIVLIALVICFIFFAYVFYLYTYRYDDLLSAWNTLYTMIRSWFHLSPLSDENDQSQLPKPPTTGEEVFYVQTPQYTYTQAQKVCQEYQAKLATKEQLQEAYRKGANWCRYGWTEGNSLYYPAQASFVKPKTMDELKQVCDAPGLIGLIGGEYKDTEQSFGVNCYGVRPETTTYKSSFFKIQADLLGGNTKTPGVSTTSKPTEPVIDKKTTNIQPFSESSWSQYSQKRSLVKFHPDVYTTVAVEHSPTSSS